MKILRLAVVAIVLLGIWRGYQNWSGGDADATTVLRFAQTAVDTIADLTYRWIPKIIGLVGGDDASAQEVALPW